MGSGALFIDGGPSKILAVQLHAQKTNRLKKR